MFLTRNIIGDKVVVGADPLGGNSNRRIDQQRTKDSSQQTSDPRSLACMQSPVKCGCVIRNVEDERVRIVCNVGCRHDMQDGTVVQNYCHKF